MVIVKLTESIQLLLSQSKMVTVQLEKDHEFSGTVLIEPLFDDCSTAADVRLGYCLVHLNEDNSIKLLLINSLDSHNMLTKKSRVV